MQAKIIIPLTPTTLLDAKKKIKKVEKEADLIEVWLDGIKKLDEKKLKEIVKATKKPMILNLKDAKEKGKFKGSDEERLEVLLWGVKANVAYIDLPIAFPKKLLDKITKKKKKTKLILSHHDFEKTPKKEALEKIANKALKSKCDVVKLVSFANKFEDCKPIFEISWDLAKEGREFITIAMGEKGIPTRIITPLIGGLGMFAILDKKAKTASGQMSVGELRSWWEVFD